MSTKLLSDLEALRAKLGLSEHRIGILVARNGKLFGRLRDGGRVWPETEASIRLAMRNLQAERAENSRGAA